jgi:ribonuclease HII
LCDEARHHAVMPTLEHEQRIGGRVAGVDEAGRGPLAGPVIAAAVIFLRAPPDELAQMLDDSKKLSPRQRNAAYNALLEASARGMVAYAIAGASARLIDQINILRATFVAMRRAVHWLPVEATHALVDGNQAPPLDVPVTTLIGGDGASLSIAAASILAKVMRDRIMDKLARRHPHYGWHTNMGYPAPAHLQAIESHGATRHHRLSFGPLAQGQLNIP